MSGSDNVRNMSSKLNVETKENLTSEIKRLIQRCLEACEIQKNTPFDASLTPDNVIEKALNYVEGLRVVIENSQTQIPTDENLIVSQLLAEMKAKTEQVEKLTEVTRGSILDVENEIQRLTDLTNIAKETLSSPKVEQKVVQKEVTQEPLLKAEETFSKLMTELYGLIQSMFPNDGHAVFDILGDLMQEMLNEESNGYIQITEENSRIIQLLKDINIVKKNPNNNMEVKLA